MSDLMFMVPCIVIIFWYFVCFLLGNSPASEFYVPTFRNTLSVPSSSYPSMKMEQTESSETSAYKIQTPGNYPEESIQHSEHGESLKSGNKLISVTCCVCILLYVAFHI